MSIMNIILHGGALPGGLADPRRRELGLAAFLGPSTLDAALGLVGTRPAISAMHLLLLDDDDLDELIDILAVERDRRAVRAEWEIDTDG